MNQVTYIGKTASGRACVLYSYIPFVALENDQNIEAAMFTHSSTDWGGSDDLDRTLELRELKLTGRSVVPNNLIKFRGCDFDHGHEYPWSISVVEIMETKSSIDMNDALGEIKEAVSAQRNYIEKIRDALFFVSNELCDIENQINRLKKKEIGE